MRLSAPQTAETPAFEQSQREVSDRKILLTRQKPEAALIGADVPNDQPVDLPHSVREVLAHGRRQRSVLRAAAVRGRNLMVRVFVELGIDRG